MNTDLFADAMSELNEKYIVEAATYKGKAKGNRHNRKWWASVAACLAVVAIALGIFPLFNQLSASPFVLTAYAMEDEAIGYTVEMGKQVPISYFETTSGIAGFVFSYSNPDKNTPSSISVITHGNYNGYIEEIVGIAIDPTQNYLIFIPSDTDTLPYTVFLSSVDMEAELIYERTISITQEGENYFAELLDETTRDMIMK